MAHESVIQQHAMRQVSVLVRNLPFHWIIIQILFYNIMLQYLFTWSEWLFVRQQHGSRRVWIAPSTLAMIFTSLHVEDGLTSIQFQNLDGKLYPPLPPPYYSCPILLYIYFYTSNIIILFCKLKKINHEIFGCIFYEFFF